MRKFILTLAFGTLIAWGSAQQKPADFKMSVAEYQKATTIRDLIKTMPEDCKILAFDVSTPIKGKLVSRAKLDDKVDWNRDQAESGNKIFITISSSTCKTKMKTEYKIVLE